MAHAQYAVGCLTAGGERIGQKVVQRLAGGQTCLQSRGDRLQFGVGERLVLVLQCENLVRNGTDLFEFLIGKAAENLFEKSHLNTA